ncbi:MAG TPA: oxidoreductase [Streptosporangiaceae bacterium]|nr:oxidoreductase [Streptosporangiaceae bacterium]
MIQDSDLNDRTAVVTGASGGIGYEIALGLAARGAHVVLASRDQGRTAAAAARISSAAPGVSVEAQVLDLASLASVRRFAARLTERHAGLDILVNNAGIAGGPRRLTADGFEAHFGTNHLGHFALTGLLLPALLARPGARVVTMSTGLAAQARIDFADLQSERRYRMTSAYGQSKLAGLLFAVELDRRARAAGAGLASLATHPGVARTSLLTGKRADWGRPARGAETLVRLVQLVFAQPAARAARPALLQAADPAARGGTYVGTRGHLRGEPAAAPFPPAALNPDIAARLWEVSEQLTGVRYDALSQPAARL